MRTFAIVLLMGVAAMAGCTEAPQIQSVTDKSDVPSNLLKEGRDLRKELLATDVIEAPEWHLGDHFGHHVFFTGGPDGGFHINTIVVKDQGDKWLLATDDKQMAKLESVFDIPIIGEIVKKDLSSTGFGSAWEPYKFPLKQGATWTRKVMVGDTFGGGEEITVKYDVVYNPAITTPDGDRPGFDIFGRTEDGKLLYAYDFVPDIQWYAHFYEYDLTTDAPEDYNFHVMSMGHGTGWTGAYYVDISKVLLADDHGMVPPGAYVDPKPYLSATVDASATYVYAFAYSAAWMGVQETIVLDPDNNRHEFQAIGKDLEEENAAVTVGEIDVPAKAGEWKVVAAGAGGAAVWGVHMWQVTETTATL